MLPSSSPFHLASDLTISFGWSVQTIAFVHKWQQRRRTLEAGGAQDDQHLAEATSVVLGAVEQLDERTAQVLADLYHLSHQLPAPGDKLLVGPLELRVETRQFEVTRPGGQEQVAVTYCLEIERYRYESRHPTPGLAADLALNVCAQ